MTDALLFTKQAWNNIWKANTIWLFSAVPILVGELLYTVFVEHRSTPLAFIPSVAVLAGLALNYIGFAGVAYIAFRLSIGKFATIGETLGAVRTFSGRIIGCGCLGLLVLLTFASFWAALRIRNPSQAAWTSNNFFFVSLPLSAFGGLLWFTFGGFFGKDWGIRQSLRAAWTSFVAHFGILAVLGVLMAILPRLCEGVIGASAILLRASSDMASLRGTAWFPFLRDLVYIVLSPLGASVFFQAHLKYKPTDSQSQAAA